MLSLIHFVSLSCERRVNVHFGNLMTATTKTTANALRSTIDDSFWMLTLREQRKKMLLTEVILKVRSRWKEEQLNENTPLNGFLMKFRYNLRYSFDVF